MEKIVKEAYDKYAEYYHQSINDKKNIWHKFMEKPAMVNFLKGEIKGKKVLDLGCGSGLFIKKLQSLGAKKIK